MGLLSFVPKIKTIDELRDIQKQVQQMKQRQNKREGSRSRSRSRSRSKSRSKSPHGRNSKRNDLTVINEDSEEISKSFNDLNTVTDRYNYFSELPLGIDDNEIVRAKRFDFTLNDQYFVQNIKINDKQ